MSEGKSNTGLWIAIGVGGLLAAPVLLFVVSFVVGIGSFFWARSSIVHMSSSRTFAPSPPVAISRENIDPPTVQIIHELPFADEQAMMGAIAKLDSKDISEIGKVLGLPALNVATTDGQVRLPITKPVAGTLTITVRGGAVIEAKFVKPTE